MKFKYKKYCPICHKKLIREKMFLHSRCPKNHYKWDWSTETFIFKFRKKNIYMDFVNLKEKGISDVLNILQEE